MKERHVTHKLRFVHIIIILFHYPQSISLNSSNVMTVDLFVSNVLFVAIVSGSVAPNNNIHQRPRDCVGVVK